MNLLILTGGMYHDFAGFVDFSSEIFSLKGHTVQALEFSQLTDTQLQNSDMIIVYTCFHECFPGPEKALLDAVRGGKNLCTVHSATVAAKFSPLLRGLYGGAFVKHPPRCTFEVYPCNPHNEFTYGISEFSISDELYIEEPLPGTTVHLMAVHEGTAYPIAWSRFEGKGRVTHLGLGHDRAVWGDANFRNLLLKFTALPQ